MSICSKSTITINGKTFKNTSATLEWLIKQLGLAEDAIEEVKDSTEDAIEGIKDTTAFNRDVSNVNVVPQINIIQSLFRILHFPGSIECVNQFLS